MRKSNEQQKNAVARQMEIFPLRTGEPTGETSGGTSADRSAGVEMLSRLEKQRDLTTDIMERVVEYENLNRAYRQVAGNGGSAGVDGMDIEGLRQWMGKHLQELRTSLLNDRYAVDAVRKVEIPKPSGGTRTLGIPTVKDRLIQQAVHQVLNRYNDPHFSEHSYGFRAHRSAHQAVGQAAQYVKEGKEWVVDIDLEKFFDKINHDRLMQRLRKGIGDKRLLRLINAYLKAGLMEGGVEEQRTAGTPQGGPLSPLLSNIVLDELDKELERRGHSFCRYADDCNIYVGSRKAGERVMTSIVGFIEKRLKLKVNREKSGVRHCTDVVFLGYTLLSGGKIRVADKSVTRLKKKIREIARRNRGVRFEQVIEELNTVIVGWSGYFRLADSWLSTFRDLDGWIRRKLRCYRLKQCGRRYTIFKLLGSLGVANDKSWNAIMYSQGWWHLSSRVAVTQALNLHWFSRQGLHTLSVMMKA
jgi:RNA-directed DNA polymerase